MRKCIPWGHRKQDGSLHVWVMSILAVALVLIYIFFVVKEDSLKVGIRKLKNASDFANLATYKEISQKELGDSGKVIFDSTDVNKVFYTYKEYLQENLNVGSNLEPQDKSFLIEPLIIESIIVYSVVDGKLTEYTYTNASKVFQMTKKDYTQAVYTPKNTKVTNTSVYTELRFKTNIIEGHDYSNVISSYTDAVN